MKALLLIELLLDDTVETVRLTYFFLPNGDLKLSLRLRFESFSLLFLIPSFYSSFDSPNLMSTAAISVFNMEPKLDLPSSSPASILSLRFSIFSSRPLAEMICFWIAMSEVAPLMSWTEWLWMLRESSSIMLATSA